MKSLYKEVFKSQREILYKRIPVFTGEGPFGPGSSSGRQVWDMVSFPNEEVFTWVHYFIDNDLRDS